jgi:hypothetical protein
MMVKVRAGNGGGLLQVLLDGGVVLLSGGKNAARGGLTELAEGVGERTRGSLRVGGVRSGLNRGL